MLLIECPQCKKTVNSFVTICPRCKCNIAKHYQFNKTEYSLEDMIKMYTQNINGYDINLMDFYIKNKENLRKTRKELAKFTGIDNYHAKKFINEFYRKYIKDTDMVKKYNKLNINQ